MVILTAILALVAGSFAMVNMGASNHANCLAAIPGSPKCIGGMDPIQFAITHISTLLSASLGVISPLAIVFLALLAVFAWFAILNIPSPLLAALSYLRTLDDVRISAAHKERHWISLLEKRDPSSSRAMNA